MKTSGHQKRLVFFWVRLTSGVWTVFVILEPDGLTSREIEVSYNFGDSLSRPFRSRNPAALKGKFFQLVGTSFIEVRCVTHRVSSWWWWSLWCPKRNTDVKTIGKAHPNLVQNNLPKSSIKRRSRSHFWAAAITNLLFIESVSSSESSKIDL